MPRLPGSKAGRSTPSSSTRRPFARRGPLRFVQNEALAYELAARFYAARGLQTICDACLRSARVCYLRWGADGKVRQLERANPHLRQGARPASLAACAGTPVENLDLATVVKVSQAVSGEIDLKKLIDTLMIIALEHAGADRGLLVLLRGDDLQIEAESPDHSRHSRGAHSTSGCLACGTSPNQFCSMSSGPGKACCWMMPRTISLSRPMRMSKPAGAGPCCVCP